DDALRHGLQRQFARPDASRPQRRLPRQWNPHGREPRPGRRARRSRGPGQGRWRGGGGAAPRRAVAQVGAPDQGDRLQARGRGVPHRRNGGRHRQGMTDHRKPSAAEHRRMRSAARLYAVQALFQMEAAGQTAEKVAREFETHRFGAIYDEDEMAEGDPDLFRRLVGEAVNWQARIDQMTDRALVAKWPIDRIDPVLRALFRAAGAELLDPSTPPKVVITEFVDVARAFFPDGREPKFVNAVLDHMAREARPEAF